MDGINGIIVAVLTSSVVSIIVSFCLEKFKEEKNYRFSEKKHVYEALIIFCQMILEPSKARFAVGTSRVDIRKLNDEEIVKQGMIELEFSIPKIRMITKNKELISEVKNFLSTPEEKIFEKLVDIICEDLKY